MKKSILFFLIVPFVLSCNLEVPESLSVRLSAKYNFAFGKMDKDLSEYISAETLAKNVNLNSETTNISFYDYNPGEKLKEQSFLIDCNVLKIPVDVGAYLEKLNFSENIKENFNFEKEIEVPSDASTVVSTPLDVSKITELLNEKINTGMKLENLSQVDIPADFKGEFSGDNKFEIIVSFKEPEMESVSFASGKIVLNFDTASDTSGFNSNFKITLVGSHENVISSVDNVDLGSRHVVDLPISGKTLEKQMTLFIEGMADNSSGVNVSFNLSASLGPDSKISKVVDLTLNDVIEVPVADQRVNFSLDEAIVDCKIGTGLIVMDAALPEGWKGVSATPKIDFSGSMAISKNDFIAVSNSSKLFAINSSLNGKKVESGELIVDGQMDISLSKATIILNQGECPDINLDVKCDVSDISDITIDLSKGTAGLSEDKLSFVCDESLPSDVSKTVTSLVLDKAGFKIEYLNTLPAGNDISIEVNSVFFGITNGKSIFEAGQLETEYKTAPAIAGSENHTVSTSSKVDVNAKIKLPGSSEEHPTYMKLSNIEMGKKYKIGVKIVPDFNWTTAVLDPSKLSETETKGTIDTDLSLKKIFNSFASDFGEDFISKIEIDEIETYGYFVIPEGAGLDQFKLKGKVDAWTKADESDKKNLVDDSSINIKTKLPVLEKNDKNTVLSIMKKDDASFYDNFKLIELLNTKTEDTIKIAYDVGLEGNQITIKKAELDNLSDTSISVVLRIVMPLKCNITDDITVDISKMASISDDDIFGRSEPTDINDIEDLLNAIKKAELNYSVENNIVIYDENGGQMPVPSMSIVFNDDEAAGNPRSKINGGRPYEMKFGKDSIAVVGQEITDLLGCYPVKIQLDAKIPKGTMYMPRNMKFAVDIKMGIDTNGTVNIFGGE